jgi:hypothetical protein
MEKPSAGMLLANTKEVQSKNHLFAAGMSLFLAHRVISLPRSISVACRAKRTLSRVYEYMAEADRRASNRLEQHVTLLAERELHHAFRRHIRLADGRLVAGDAGIVDHDRVVGDGAPRFTVR